MFAPETPRIIWNTVDVKLHDMIEKDVPINIEEIRNNIINKCTEFGIITAWQMAAIKNNSIYINTLIKFEKYNSDILHSLIPYFDEIHNINQQIIIKLLEPEVLRATNLSKENYMSCYYYMTIINVIPPAVENSLKIVARGLNYTENFHNTHILSMIMSYLDVRSYGKLFKAVTEKDDAKKVIEKDDDQLMISYGGQLLNKTYEFLFGCCNTSSVDKTPDKPNTKDNIVKSLNKLYEEPKNKFSDLFYWISAEDLDATVDEMMKAAELQKQSTYLDLHLEIHDIHHDSIMDPIIL